MRHPNQSELVTYFIDGTNLCYWLDTTRPTLHVLLELLIALKKEKNRSFYCIFDANTQYKLPAEERETYQHLLEFKDYFYQITGGKRADDFILELANSYDAPVISNDNYSDPKYAKYSWKERDFTPKRLFMGEVIPLRGDIHLIISELDMHIWLQDTVYNTFKRFVRTIQPASSRHRGKIKFFNKQEGWGLIGYETDIYFHRAALLENIEEGMEVEFVTGTNDKGVCAEQIISGANRRDGKPLVTGVVESYDEVKTIGMIKTDETGEILFFYKSYIDDSVTVTLQKGMQVEFTVGTNKNGPCARNIRPTVIDENKYFNEKIAQLEAALKEKDTALRERDTLIKDKDIHTQQMRKQYEQQIQEANTARNAAEKNLRQLQSSLNNNNNNNEKQQQGNNNNNNNNNEKQQQSNNKTNEQTQPTAHVQEKNVQQQQQEQNKNATNDNTTQQRNNSSKNGLHNTTQQQNNNKNGQHNNSLNGNDTSKETTATNDNKDQQQKAVTKDKALNDTANKNGDAKQGDKQQPAKNKSDNKQQNKQGKKHDKDQQAELGNNEQPETAIKEADIAVNEQRETANKEADVAAIAPPNAGTKRDTAPKHSNQKEKNKQKITASKDPNAELPIEAPAATEQQQELQQDPIPDTTPTPELANPQIDTATDKPTPQGEPKTKAKTTAKTTAKTSRKPQANDKNSTEKPKTSAKIIEEVAPKTDPLPTTQEPDTTPIVENRPSTIETTAEITTNSNTATAPAPSRPTITADYFDTPMKRKQWWASLQPQWKKAFNVLVGKGEVTDVPNDEQLQQIFSTQKLNFKLAKNKLSFQLTNLSGVQYLSNLNSLNVSEQAISDLKGTEHLSKLTHFNGSKNRLTSLDGIDLLSNLEELICSNNQLKITAFDNIATRLPRLRSLDCKHNQLTKEEAIQLKRSSSIKDLKV